jgi:hypothetical protein
MKKTRYISLIIVVLATALLSQCKKETYTLGPPPSKIAGLNGDWKLYSVVQVDELSLAKGERNISEFYIDPDSTDVMQVNFNSDNFTFFISLGSIGRNYLPASGTWSFDNNDYPQYIYLEDEAGIITTLKLQGPTRPVDTQLKFSFQRSCIIDGEVKEYVGYRYEFNRE